MPKEMLAKETLRKLQESPESAVFKVPKSLHLAIHPQYLGNVQLGILNYLNNEINHYNTEIDGILMGYGKIRLKEPKAEVLNEEHYLHLDIYSNFWVFRPQVDSILNGVVNKKSPAHVSILVHGLFNVPCYKNLDSESDAWRGSTVSVGDTVKVRILRMDLNQKVPFLLGELLESSIDEGTTTEEPMNLMLVENIKEEKVWEDLTTKDEDQLNPDAEDGSSVKKKKKKKKKKSQDSDQEEEDTPKLGSSFLLSKDTTSPASKRRDDSPILSQVEEKSNPVGVNGDATEEMKERLCQSLIVPKKKKKKKKNRSLSPSEREASDDEATKEALSTALLASLKNTKASKSSKNAASVVEDETKTKEDLSNSLILEMLSKEKKSKKKEKKKAEGASAEDSSVNISLNDTPRKVNDEDECKALSESLILSVLNKEKKSKKRKSLASIQSDILAAVDSPKRKRTLSESSSQTNSSAKKSKLDFSEESSSATSSPIVVLRPPSSVQDPRLPLGWTFSVSGPSKRKVWISPEGTKFSTLKSATLHANKSK